MRDRAIGEGERSGKGWGNNLNPLSPSSLLLRGGKRKGKCQSYPIMRLPCVF